MARSFAARHVIASLVSLVSPQREPRDAVRAQPLELGVPSFEVHIATPPNVCEQRDPKALSARARADQGEQITGIPQASEEPFAPEVGGSTHDRSVVDVGQAIVEVILRSS